MKVNLYKWNKITGFWKFVRQHEIEDAEEWQRIYQKDEPEEYFYTSRRTPQFNPAPWQRTKFKREEI